MQCTFFGDLSRRVATIPQPHSIRSHSNPAALTLQVHSQMAASAWLVTPEHERKVDGLKQQLRCQHGSPCLPLLDKALRHGQQVSSCCYLNFGSVALCQWCLRVKRQRNGQLAHGVALQLCHGWDMAAKCVAVMMACCLFAG